MDMLNMSEGVRYWAGSVLDNAVTVSPLVLLDVQAPL